MERLQDIVSAIDNHKPSVVAKALESAAETKQTAFKTSDLDRAAYLVTRGAKVTGIDAQRDKWVFTLEHANLREFLDEWNNGDTVQISIRNVFANRMALKRAGYSLANLAQ